VGGESEGTQVAQAKQGARRKAHRGFRENWGGDENICPLYTGTLYPLCSVR